MYFKTIKSSETGKKLADIYKRGREAWNERSEFIEQLMVEFPNMTGQFREKGGFAVWGGIYSLMFSEAPDPNIWVEVDKNEYVPNSGSEEGQKLWERIQALPVVKYPEINACVNHYNNRDIVGFKVGELFFGLEVDPKWKVKMPEDCIEITYSEFNSL